MSMAIDKSWLKVEDLTMTLRSGRNSERVLRDIWTNNFNKIERLMDKINPDANEFDPNYKRLHDENDKSLRLYLDTCVNADGSVPDTDSDFDEMESVNDEEEVGESEVSDEECDDPI